MKARQSLSWFVFSSFLPTLLLCGLVADRAATQKVLHSFLGGDAGVMRLVSPVSGGGDVDGDFYAGRGRWRSPR